MKTLVRVLKAIASVSLVLFLGFLILVAANSGGSPLLKTIASRIPLVRNFVVKTFPTYLYGRTYESVGILKVARYDIDFLASFTGMDGRYVALYPFTVESEIALDRISKDPATGNLMVPAPEYQASIDGKKASSMVFMDTLELDYNKMLAPVLAMYREKGIDLAMEDDAFASDCRARAEKYLGDLLGATEISWADEAGASAAHPAEVVAVAAGAANPQAENSVHPVETAAPQADAVAPPSAVQAPAETASRYVPVTFLHAGDKGRTQFAEGSSLRDAFVIRTSRFGANGTVAFRFGKAGSMLGSFDRFAARLCETSPIEANPHIVFRYHDPSRAGDLTFASYADEGYRSAFSYLRGGTDVYYLEAVSDREINEEAFAQNVAPNVLYLAASATPSPSVPELAGEFDSYTRAYRTALDEIRHRRYGRQLALSLGEMDGISLQMRGKESDDATLMREVLDIQDGHTDLLAMLARSDAASATGKYSPDSELGGNVAALFWVMRNELGLTADEAEGFRRDLLSKGAALSRELVESLSAEERNILYLNFFASHLPDDKEKSVYVDENGKAETWFYYGKAATEWKEKTTQLKVASKLEESGMEKGNKFMFVFSEPEDKAGFFTDYHALAFDGAGVAYYHDFSRWIKLFGSASSVPFGEIETVDGSAVIGKRAIVGHPEIASLLAAFGSAFSSDTYNRDRVVDLLSRDLEKEVLARLGRPEF